LRRRGREIKMTNLKKITWSSEKRNINELKFAEYNPRKLTEEQKKQLSKSLDKFGLAEPIVINKNNVIIGGHQRLKILKNKNVKEIDVSVPERLLNDDEEKELNLRLNKNLGEWDFTLLTSNFDADFLENVGFDVDDINFGEENETTEHSDSQRGKSYNDLFEKDINTFKLAYRIEAAYISQRKKCIELFSGRQALTYWYKRCFENIITNDMQEFEGLKHNYCMTAYNFIIKELKNHLDFDYIDFDDEGCPSKEITAFFKEIENKKNDSFVLSVTDGNGLNLKSRGKCNFYKTYLYGEDKVIKCEGKHYELFDDIFNNFIIKISKRHGFVAKNINFYRKESGNVIYANYLISAKNK